MGVVDEALDRIDGPDRSCLQHVVEIARSLAPDATEGMSYGMPALKLDGKPLVADVATAKTRGGHRPAADRGNPEVGPCGAGPQIPYLFATESAP